jgi:hypothetical protein
MHIQRIASATTLVKAVLSLFLDRRRLVDGPLVDRSGLVSAGRVDALLLLGGRRNDRARPTRRFRTAARRFHADLAGRELDPSSRRSRRPDLGVGVDVDHPVLDQLWSPVFLWVRREPDPGMRSAAH